jgi:hypothetical protein
MRAVVALSALLLVAGCGSPGTVYRGAPPAGMTDAEYRCKLTGQSCPERQMGKWWPEMKDGPNGPPA